MIDERHIKFIELLVTGEYTMQEIADLVGVARNTLYTWLEREEGKAEMDKRLHEVRTNAAKLFDAKLDKAIDEYWKLAMTTTDVRTKQVALSYWIDRSLGKTTSKLDINDTRNESNVSEEDILSAIDEARADDNVLHIAK